MNWRLWFCTGVLFALATAPAQAAAEKQLFMASGNAVRTSNLDGSNLLTMSHIGGTRGLAVDSQNRHIYYIGGGVIRRSSIDGTDLETVLNMGEHLSDIAFDGVNDKLYFCDNRNNIIYRSNLYGLGVEIIVPASGTPMTSYGILNVELDVENGKLYWSDSYHETVNRSDLDGSNVEILVSNTIAGGLSLDTENDRVYWSTAGYTIGSGTVRRIDMDGSNETVIVTGMWAVGDVAVDPESEQLYWTDGWSSGPTDYDSRVLVSDLDGNNERTLFNFGPDIGEGVGDLEVAIIPEPATMLLLGLGGCALLKGRRS